MRLPFGLMAPLLLACNGSADLWPTPGANLVLEYGRAAGLAWSPLWCRSWSSVRPEVCLRMLPDSSEVGFQWNMKGRPHQFTHSWDRLSPVRAFDLRDSIRRDLMRRGARWIAEHPRPVDWEHRVHGRQAKWCMDSAAVYLSHSWQEGQPFEFVDFLVGSGPDPDCSSEAFRACSPSAAWRSTDRQPWPGP